MIIINVLIWIWVITFLINTIWFQYNPNPLDDPFYENKLLYKSNYSYYFIVIHIAILIIAPIVFYYVIIGELKNYIIVWNMKRKLRKKANKLENKEVKDQLKKQINNIKY